MQQAFQYKLISLLDDRNAFRKKWISLAVRANISIFGGLGEHDILDLLSHLFQKISTVENARSSRTSEFLP
jgi:hypothetical protein